MWRRVHETPSTRSPASIRSIIEPSPDAVPAAEVRPPEGGETGAGSGVRSLSPGGITELVGLALCSYDPPSAFASQRNAAAALAPDDPGSAHREGPSFKFEKPAGASLNAGAKAPPADPRGPSASPVLAPAPAGPPRTRDVGDPIVPAASEIVASAPARLRVTGARSVAVCPVRARVSESSARVTAAVVPELEPDPLVIA